MNSKTQEILRKQIYLEIEIHTGPRLRYYPFVYFATTQVSSLHIHEPPLRLLRDVAAVEGIPIEAEPGSLLGPIVPEYVGAYPEGPPAERALL